jgi:uncharacterized protein YigE (DUF2233 family)
LTVRQYSRFLTVIGVACVLLTGVAHGAECRRLSYQGNAYTACEADLAKDDVQLFLNDAAGQPFGGFSALQQFLDVSGRELVFAMNAGMYDYKLAPIGLYVEHGRKLKPANTNDGSGNFHLKPNGVFYVDKGRAGVVETGKFLKRGLKPVFASQSGPMLVIEGRLHPRFLVDSTSRKRRNGVGVKDGGRLAVFVISENFVTFHAFGSLFRDHLKTPNALFFDGTISSLHANALNRSDWGRAMGPIIGVVREKAE